MGTPGSAGDLPPCSPLGPWQERLNQAASHEWVLLNALPAVADASVSVTGTNRELLLEIICTLKGRVLLDEVVHLLEEIPRHLEDELQAPIRSRELHLALASPRSASLNPVGSRK